MAEHKIRPALFQTDCLKSQERNRGNIARKQQAPGSHLGEQKILAHISHHRDKQTNVEQNNLW